MKAALIDANHFSALNFTVYATTGNVATAADVIDFIAMAAVGTVTAADRIGTYAVFSMALPPVLSQQLLIILLLASANIPVLCNGCCLHTLHFTPMLLDGMSQLLSITLL